MIVFFMKIGLIGDETSESAIEVHADLPDEVKFAHDAVRKRWVGKPASNIGTVPWMVYDNQTSHGPDSPGLIFYSQRKVRFPIVKGFGDGASNCSEDVRVRISIGMDRPHKQRRKPLLITPSGFNRMHFGIMASRGLFPRDYLEAKREDDRNCIGADKEIVLVSLRWLAKDGGFEFDDWSGEGCKFHWDRTTYAIYYPGRGGFGAGKEETRKYLDDVPRRERLLQVDERIRGYEPVLGFLSQFGNVSTNDAEKTPKMNPKQGIEYLMGNVLPAMDEFVRA